MIEQVSLPRGWNKHHTLYYRRWYQSRTLTNEWRESSAMIVPMRVMRGHNDHQKLHDDVPPIDLPSDELAAYALRICDEIEFDSERMTRLEAFQMVRDELLWLSKRRRTRSLGNEAVRFVDFFDRQLEHMSELPKRSS